MLNCWCFLYVVSLQVNVYPCHAAIQTTFVSGKQLALPICHVPKQHAPAWWPHLHLQAVLVQFVLLSHPYVCVICMLLLANANLENTPKSGFQVWTANLNFRCGIDVAYVCSSRCYMSTLIWCWLMYTNTPSAHNWTSNVHLQSPEK